MLNMRKYIHTGPKNHAAKRSKHVERNRDGSSAAAAEVIIWVDQFGHTLSVETKGACTPTQPVGTNVRERAYMLPGLEDGYMLIHKTG